MPTWKVTSDPRVLPKSCSLFQTWNHRFTLLRPLFGPAMLVSWRVGAVLAWAILPVRFCAPLWSHPYGFVVGDCQRGVPGFWRRGLPGLLRASELAPGSWRACDIRQQCRGVCFCICYAHSLRMVIGCRHSSLRFPGSLLVSRELSPYIVHIPKKP